MKFIRLAILILFINNAYSQDYPPLGSQYLMDNKFLTSPAWSGYSDAFQLRATYLKQWVGIDDSPLGQIVSVNGMPINNVGFGIIIHYDKAAFASQLRTQFSFAYHIEFGKRDLKILSFGVSGIFQSNQLDGSRFSTTIRDPSINRGISTIKSPNFNFGVLYRENDFYISYING